MALEVIAPDFYTPTTPVPGATVGLGSFDLLYDKTTGKVQLKQSGLNLDPAILYEDGSYRADGLRIPELSSNGSSLTPKAFEKHEQIKQLVRAIARDANGVVPQFIIDNAPPTTNNSYPGTNPGIASALPGGDLLSTPPGEFFNTFQNLKFGPNNEKDALKGGKYPLDILDGQQDTLQITQYNYKPPTGESFLGVGEPVNLKASETSGGGLQRNSALLGNPLGVVVLPMPNQVEDSNNVAWGPDTINDLTAAIASKAFSDLPAFAATMAGVTAGTAGVNAIFNSVGLSNANLSAEALRNLAAIGMVDPTASSKLVRPAVASLLLKTGGVEIPPETILSRGLGIVPNSNMELLFNAPTLRSFRFSYRLTPRNKNETTQVKKILRFFKQGMAPKKINSGSGVGGSSLLLSTPNVFKLEYKTVGNQSIKGVNKFKICALTGFSVNYTPDGSWSAYDDPNSPGQPVSLIMSMSFQEIEPVYADDYTDENLSPGLTRNDLPSIGLDDIGY